MVDMVYMTQFPRFATPTTLEILGKRDRRVLIKRTQIYEWDLQMFVFWGRGPQLERFGNQARALKRQFMERERGSTRSG